MGEWISIEEKVPEPEALYLCYFSDGVIETFYRWESDDVEGVAWGVGNTVVTHWMSLPEPPRGKDDE